ncbi:MAG: hypothetical protein QM734_15190 [Cyclobacteriaceae bacterium]
MKPLQNRIMNLLMGALVLITLSYFVPSTPRHRNVTQTEWVQTLTHDKKKVEGISKSPVDSFSVIEFVWRLFDFNNRIKVLFNRSKLYFKKLFTEFTHSKIIFSDDDYLLS